MTNIEKLALSGNKNNKLFTATIVKLMHSQGFYGRLYKAVNNLNYNGYNEMLNLLEQQDFKDSLDVVFWLEC